MRPRYELIEDEKGYTLTLEMPGVTKDDLDISVSRSSLAITGRRRESLEGLTALLRERQIGEFRREFRMDDTVDTSKIDAKLDNGPLFPRIPKAEKVMPRKVSIN
ncbi:MAG: Hsp20/alpha crystallin family protein [bacterium]